jgi:hypothetical protein
MKVEIKGFLKHSGIELLLYVALVVGYFLLVLRYLGNWLNWLFTENRNLYAWVALGLIVGQGVLLELVTGALLRLIRSGKGR